MNTESIIQQIKNRHMQDLRKALREDIKQNGTDTSINYADKLKEIRKANKEG